MYASDFVSMHLSSHYASVVACMRQCLRIYTCLRMYASDFVSMHMSSYLCICLRIYVSDFALMRIIALMCKFKCNDYIYRLQVGFYAMIPISLSSLFR